MDEVAPEEPALLTPPPDNGVGSTPNSVLGKETIKKMKVTDLCIAIEARGLSKNGLKAVLIDRLKAAVVEAGLGLEICCTFGLVNLTPCRVCTK